MNRIEFQLPTLQHKTASENFRNDFFDIQEHFIPGSAMLDQMEYEQWLIHNTNNRHENTVSSGWVVATTFFAVRKCDQKIIGMIDIRHNLENDFLTQYGGHIGYSVCPDERNKGYATEMLKMGLEYAKSLNIEKVMIACFSDNIPSIRTIEKSGGILSETKHYTDGNIPYIEGKHVNIYWIEFKMKTLGKSIAMAMDSSEDVAIVPFLPYILQDFWELGTPPEIVINFVEAWRAATLQHAPSLLDLGCGKGAVSVKLAAALKYNCYGIDGIPEFIEAAKEKAREYGVATLCRFEVGDIREKIDTLDKFDVIILGAIGPVFGDYYATLTTLSEHLNPDGMIIINDAYIDDASTFQYPSVLQRRELLEQVGQAGMELIDKNTHAPTNSAEEFENLQKRCKELIAKYPEKTSLFENYLQSQAEEYDALENKMIGSVMVFRKKPVLEVMSVFFNNRAPIYEEKHLEHIGGMESKQILASFFPPHTKAMIDLGIGTGLELEEIFKRFPGIAVTGLDVAENMLYLLQQKYPDRNVHLHCKSYLDYDFGNALYDVALSVMTLHHYNHKTKTDLYRRIHNSLNINGVYIECDYMLSEHEYEHPQEKEDFYFSEFERLKKEYCLSDHIEYHYDTPCTVSNQKKMLLDAGFTSVQEVWRKNNTVILVADK